MKQCQCYQLAKNSINTRSGVKEIKNILMYDLLYKVALDIVGPLLKTKDGNMYVLVTIDHYSKWCEARLVKDHDATTTVRFLEEEIMYRFGVLRFIFTKNGGEWMA